MRIVDGEKKCERKTGINRRAGFMYSLYSSEKHVAIRANLNGSGSKRGCYSAAGLPSADLYKHSTL